MTNQDTINVDLPIKAVDGGSVAVGDHLLTRKSWRDAEANPDDWTQFTVALAPAVVAWIERDEWEPLPIPEVGRKIQATLRDGRVETLEVRDTKDASHWTLVRVAGGYRAHHIERVLDEDLRGPSDIIAWEYVDEPAEPAETLISAVQLSVMAQFIEDQCFCGSCGSGDEHVRKLLAKAGLTVAGESND